MFLDLFIRGFCSILLCERYSARILGEGIGKHLGYILEEIIRFAQENWFVGWPCKWSTYC